LPFREIRVAGTTIVETRVDSSLRAVTGTDPLERALAHADLGLPVPPETRLRFVKWVMARAARLFTNHQVEVNRGLAEAVLGLRTALEEAETRAKAIADDLADEIAAVRTELSELQVSILEGGNDVALRDDAPSGSAVGNEPVDEIPGVNCIGDFAGGTGLVEATRRLVQTLASSGVDVQVTDFDLPLPKSPIRTLPEVDGLPRGRSHDIELWCVNVNEFRHVDDATLRPCGGPHRYVIGVWAWEAPSLPGWARREVARVDEIWVPSRFVRRAFRSATNKPITVWRHVVDASVTGGRRRSNFGLPEQAVLFFFNFDAGSSDGRKNPWGVIRAFERAFTDDERRGPARLVLKTQNLTSHPSLRAALQASLDRVNGILIDQELPRDGMNALLSSIDVYVSLHRGEGFGLGIAEAMVLGKPVIVTAYSGNMDYTTRTNSCLVGYTLRPVGQSDHRLIPHGEMVYEPGLIWAEPNIDQAARWMRYLYEHPEARDRIGAAGAQTVRNQFNGETVGNLVANRLVRIRREVLRGGATCVSS
jgi:glycosyltransferase involved in cell wall biosynthesis